MDDKERREREKWEKRKGPRGTFEMKPPRACRCYCYCCRLRLRTGCGFPLESSLFSSPRLFSLYHLILVWHHDACLCFSLRSPSSFQSSALVLSLPLFLRHLSSVVCGYPSLPFTDWRHERRALGFCRVGWGSRLTDSNCIATE